MVSDGREGNTATGCLRRSPCPFRRPPCIPPKGGQPGPSDTVQQKKTHRERALPTVAYGQYARRESALPCAGKYMKVSKKGCPTEGPRTPATPLPPDISGDGVREAYLEKRAEPEHIERG